MSTILAFDVYGTLIDTRGITATLADMMGAELAPAFSSRWREKQLEYSFRRGLMKRYKPFPVCTRDALEFTCSELGQPLESGQIERLMKAYRKLPAFDDVEPALESLQSGQFRLVPFSNGPAEDVRALLEHAGLKRFFADIVSVDEIQSFKPDPQVYRHLLARTAAAPESCWLISSNPFDILGAASCNLHTAWIRRNTDVIFDPWEQKPQLEVQSLQQFAAALVQ